MFAKKTSPAPLALLPQDDHDNLDDRDLDDSSGSDTESVHICQ